MAKGLLGFAPKDMGDDEQTIADGYRSSWKVSIVAAAIIGAATYYGEVKHVVAAGAFITFVAVTAAEGRLYDLCIRLRRTNELLRAKASEREGN